MPDEPGVVVVYGAGAGAVTEGGDDHTPFTGSDAGTAPEVTVSGSAF